MLLVSILENFSDNKYGTRYRRIEPIEETECVINATATLTRELQVVTMIRINCTYIKVLQYRRHDHLRCVKCYTNIMTDLKS